jgi:taurine dioxygenase
VNPGFTWGIEDMEPDAAHDLLEALFKHSRQREHRYTHKWQPHDLLCWDNRSVMHHATPYDTQYTRHMHRTTIRGGVPV